MRHIWYEENLHPTVVMCQSVGLFVCDGQRCAVLKARRAASPSEEEKAEDLAMSKELVNILIKEVYNKLLQSGVAVESVCHSTLKPIIDNNVNTFKFFDAEKNYF